MKFNLVVTLIYCLLGNTLTKILPKCQQVKERKNIIELSTEELRTFFSAINKMHSETSPSRWDHYAKLHTEYYDQVHSNSQFLVWHRMMLYAIERDLRVHEPNVTLPYWDWTINYDNPSKDPIFFNYLLGGPGDNRSHCVKNGQFKDFQPYYWHSGMGSSHCLTRNPNLFTKVFTNPDVIDMNYLSDPNLQSFAIKIEGVPHGTVHNNIGSEFSGRASPGDPLFYLHHAFVDKLWFDWQMRHPQQYYDYPLPLSQKLAPWRIPIEEVINPFDLCYYYAERHFPWHPHPNDRKMALASSSTTPPPASSPVRSPDPLPASFIDMMHLNETEIRHQEQLDRDLLHRLNLHLHL